MTDIRLEINTPDADAFKRAQVKLRTDMGFCRPTEQDLRDERSNLRATLARIATAITHTPEDIKTLEMAVTRLRALNEVLACKVITNKPKRTRMQKFWRGVRRLINGRTS